MDMLGSSACHFFHFYLIKPCLIATPIKDSEKWSPLMIKGKDVYKRYNAAQNMF